MLVLEYNLTEIGERLKKERKEYGFKSHDALCDYIKENNYRSFKRQTISKWEQGKECPPLDVLLTLCKLYNCEVGYLLCEYDCKYRENTNIKETIGLTEENIEYLKRIKNNNSKFINSINFLISSDNFDNMLSYLTEYIEKTKLFLGLNKIKKDRLHKIEIAQSKGEDVVYTCDNGFEEYRNNTRKEMELTEYHLDTHFRYIIKEVYRKADNNE